MWTGSAITSSSSNRAGCTYDRSDAEQADRGADDVDALLIELNRWAETVDLAGAVTTGSAAEIEGGELMTVVEATAVCSARIILTSRASS
jgi:hypothetical protein